MKIKELTEISHKNTRNDPFTESELNRINHMLTKLDERNITDLTAKQLGFRGEETDLSEEMWAYTRQARTNGTKIEELFLEQIYAQDQNGVGIKNIKSVFEHWNTAPLPEVLLLPNGYYWLIEGHHRVSLEILAGRKKLKFFVYYEKRKRKNKWEP